MRVEELLNTKPLVAKSNTAAVDTSQATITSGHAILAEAAKKPYKARKPYKPYKSYKPYKPYKPYTTESEADSTSRKMRLKEFLLHYHSGLSAAPFASPDMQAGSAGSSSAHT